MWSFTLGRLRIGRLWVRFLCGIDFVSCGLSVDGVGWGQERLGVWKEFWFFIGYGEFRRFFRLDFWFDLLEYEILGLVFRFLFKGKRSRFRVGVLCGGFSQEFQCGLSFFIRKIYFLLRGFLNLGFVFSWRVLEEWRGGGRG